MKPLKLFPRRSTASPARTGPTTRPTARTARSSSTCPTTTRSRTGPSRARTAASPGAARGDARRRRRVRLRLHAAHGRRLRRHLPRAGHPGAVDQVRLLQRQVAHPAHVRRGRRLRADAQQRAEPVARRRPTCPMGNAAPRASLEGATGLLGKKNRRPLGVSDGVTYCTGDPTRTVDRYYSLQYPLDVVDFDEGVWTNNVDLFDGRTAASRTSSRTRRRRPCPRRRSSSTNATRPWTR